MFDALSLNLLLFDLAQLGYKIFNIYLVNMGVTIFTKTEKVRHSLLLSMKVGNF